jgi:hypothetical protein
MLRRRVAKGQSLHFALRKNSEPFRRGTTVKYVTNVQFDACYPAQAGMTPLGTDQMAIDIGRREFITLFGGAAVA